MSLTAILTELQRRVIFFEPTTTLPSGPFGFDGDPNTVSFGGTPFPDAQTLLVNSPLGTRYSQSDGTQWYKKSTAPMVWEQFGAGGAGSGVVGEVATKTISEVVLVNDGNASPTPEYYNPIEDPNWDWEAFNSSPVQPQMNFSTIANALKYADNYKWTQGATLTIEIDENYTINEQLQMFYIDYSFVIISTNGPNGVEIDSTSWTVASGSTYKPFIHGNSSKLPRINTKIRKDIAADTDTVCLYLEDHCLVNTFVNMEIANFDYPIVANNSIVNIKGVDINNCLNGVVAENSVFDLNDSLMYDIFNGTCLTMTNCNTTALGARFEQASSPGSGGIQISVNGGYLNMTGTEIDTSNDITVSNGGTIVMNEIYDLTPTLITKDYLTVTQTPNIIRSEGVIYSELWNNGTIEYSPGNSPVDESDTWVITHNLRKYPSITILDGDGNQAFADIAYTNENVVTIIFSEPIIGTAYLN